MSVRIQFDQPEWRWYTNLNFITGNVILVLPTDATLSAVTVKLEGESRTRLAASRPGYSDREKKRTELEVHKILYKVLTVFPTPELRERSTTASYTLLAGQYVYPFKFKFPFNNDCQVHQSPFKDIKLGQLKIDPVQEQMNHVKKTLPPSLTGFPGEAEIKYYVKATVARPKFYQENLRTIADIKFLPIEPPRPPNRHEETFARRRKQFQKYPSQSEKKSLFSKKGPASMAEDEPPAFQVDARLPSPAILTCDKPLPLRILVEKLNDSSATAYLKMLQIELIGHTLIRAQDLDREERMTWVMTSQANMNMPLGNPTDRSKKEWKIPSRLWDDLPIPHTVCPSFQTCNISRRYELEVRIGLAHADGNGVKPELIVLPLRLPVLVYSGIAPPAQLLEAMAKNPRPQPPLMIDPMPAQSMGENTTVWPSESGLVTPTETPTTPMHELNAYPAQIGMPHSHDEQSDIPDIAPPSYEDAMAEDIGPVDGPRRDQNIVDDPVPQRPAFNPDSKSGLGRRVSERLFSSSGSVSGRDRAASLASNMDSMSIAEDQTMDKPVSPTTPTAEISDRKLSWRQSLGRGKN